ncbi:hypothetical protein KKA14_00595, partial [bacterium]|nr:hypothetical protein [bacterium]
MKTANRKYFFGILAVLFLFALLACKMEKIDSETSTVSIDISPIIQQLAVPSSSVAQTSDEGPSKVSSPVDSPAQDIIKTLIITPLSYTTHGRPYGSTEPVTDAVLDDIEKDVPNSLPYIKFIQLYPGVDTIVELEVPSMSGGW